MCIVAFMPAECCGLDGEPLAEPMRGCDSVGAAAEFDHCVDRGEAVLAAEILDTRGVERDVLLEVWPPAVLGRHAPATGAPLIDRLREQQPDPGGEVTEGGGVDGGEEVVCSTRSGPLPPRCRLLLHPAVGEEEFTRLGNEGLCLFERNWRDVGERHRLGRAGRPEVGLPGVGVNAIGDELLTVGKDLDLCLAAVRHDESAG